METGIRESTARATLRIAPIMILGVNSRQECRMFAELVSYRLHLAVPIKVNAPVSRVWLHAVSCDVA